MEWHFCEKTYGCKQLFVQLGLNSVVFHYIGIRAGRGQHRRYLHTPADLSILSCGLPILVHGGWFAFPIPLDDIILPSFPRSVSNFKFYLSLTVTKVSYVSILSCGSCNTNNVNSTSLDFSITINRKRTQKSYNYYHRSQCKTVSRRIQTSNTVIFFVITSILNRNISIIVYCFG